MNFRHVDAAQVVPYPKYQRVSAAASRSVRGKPMIHGLIEVDVTRARAALRDFKERTGESLSFTAFIATCLARAVDENKAVQAFRQGGRRLALFEDVDICVRVERAVGGHKYVTLHILRAANRKSFRELHDEIRAAQTENAQDSVNRYHILSRLPVTLYEAFLWGFVRVARRRPQLWKDTLGTVGITSVGMFGGGAGWGIPATAPTALMLTVGGIGQKREMVDGHPTVREYLSLTISVDHDIVDGAPAARFTRRLKELIESGFGLDEIATEPAQAAAVGAPPQTAGAAPGHTQ